MINPPWITVSFGSHIPFIRTFYEFVKFLFFCGCIKVYVKKKKKTGISQKHKKIVTAGYNIKQKWKLFHLRLQAKSHDLDAHLRIYSANVFS